MQLLDPITIAELRKNLVSQSVAGNVYFVIPSGNSNATAFTSKHRFTNPDGTDSVHNTLTSALAAVVSGRGDVIYVAPGELDEDVEVTKGNVSIVGLGSRHSVRITGVATGSGGTATAMKIDGASEVGLYNLNLEGRAGGAGLAVTGQVRRLDIKGNKIHGGTNALSVLVPSGAQPVDIRLEENVIANATNGINIAYSGGDPGHQFHIKNNTFMKIATDCIVQNGATHDYVITGNVFCANDGTEPTQFLDIDDTGTTGFVANNVFHTTVFSAAKFAVATGVLFANNVSQAENPSAGVGGTSGRPD